MHHSFYKNNSRDEDHISGQQFPEMPPQQGENMPGRSGMQGPGMPGQGPGMGPWRPAAPTPPGMPGQGPGMGPRRPAAPTPPGMPPRQEPGMGPRRPAAPTPPGMPPRQGPGMEQQPRTAPPDFIPQAPNMEGRGMRQPGGMPYRERFRGEFRTHTREFFGCLNRFTYLWLINGSNFWFYPTFVDRMFVMGFRWRRDRWEYTRINVNRILFFSCF